MASSTLPPDLFDTTTLISLASTVAILAVAYGTSLKALAPSTPGSYRFLFIWHLFDALIHFFLEGSFLYHVCLPLPANREPIPFWPPPPSQQRSTSVSLTWRTLDRMVLTSGTVPLFFQVPRRDLRSRGQVLLPDPARLPRPRRPRLGQPGRGRQPVRAAVDGLRARGQEVGGRRYGRYQPRAADGAGGGPAGVSGLLRHCEEEPSREYLDDYYCHG